MGASGHTAAATRGALCQWCRFKRASCALEMVLSHTVKKLPGIMGFSCHQSLHNNEYSVNYFWSFTGFCFYQMEHSQILGFICNIFLFLRKILRINLKT